MLLRRLLALSLFPATIAAQGIPGAEYAARRDSLAARLGSGVVVAFGAPSPTGISRPAQLPAFRFLTGFLEPDAALVLVLRGGRASGTIYTQARDPRRALYDGFPPDVSVVAQRTGLEVRPIASLAPELDSLARTALPFYTLRDFSGADYAESDSLTRGASFMRAFAGGHAGLELHDAHPTVDSLRARKSPAELALIRRAIDLTVSAQRDAMRTVRPGMWEYELEALFTSAFRRGGGDGPSFGSIIGSGPNSTQYHYGANDRRMQPGDVVVMDVGASFEGYAPGDVFTIEPGVYVSTRLLDILPDTPRNRAMIAKVRPAVERYADIGVRIEDDYAITSTGVEWLSRGAPREIPEIEAEMARRGR
jgi:Xaa-Pro aminopeptidase